jgi:hypothetical protein
MTVNTQMVREIVRRLDQAKTSGVRKPIAVLLGERFPEAEVLHWVLTGQKLVRPTGAVEGPGEPAVVLVAASHRLAGALRLHVGQLGASIARKVDACTAADAYRLLYLLGERADLVELRPCPQGSHQEDEGTGGRADNLSGQ